MSMSVLRLREALEMMMSPFAIEELTSPLVVAVGPRDEGPSARALAVLSAWPGVSIAVVDQAGAHPGWIDAFDVIVSEPRARPRDWVAPAGGTEEAVQLVGATVGAHPQAAVVAAQVLRAGRVLGVDAALVVESLAYATLQGGAEHRLWLQSNARARAVRPSRESREADAPSVRSGRDGPVLRIVLDRPEVHNAFSRAMRDELIEVLRVATADPTISRVVLTGAGSSFCSGGDLSEFGTGPDPVSAHVVRSERNPAWWMAQVGAKTRVEIQGACVGAGFEMAAWAAEVIAARDAVFFLPEIGMGLLPGAGGTASVARRIGRHRAAYLMLSGIRIDAPTALAWGMVDRLV